MPALLAVRLNADLKAESGSLRAAGTASKVARLAIIRRRATLANARLRDGRA